MYHDLYFSHFSGESELAGLPWFSSSIFFGTQSLEMSSASFFHRPHALPFTHPTVSSHWREHKVLSQLAWLHPFFIHYCSPNGRGVAPFTAVL